MRTAITPFLWFDDQAEEAARFYCSVFPNSRLLSFQRYGEAGPGRLGSVMTARFELDGHPFVALNGGPVPFESTKPSRSSSTAPTRPRSIGTGRPSPTAERRSPAGGSRIGSGSAGRWCRSSSTPCSPIPTPAGHNG